LSFFESCQISPWCAASSRALAELPWALVSAQTYYTWLFDMAALIAISAIATDGQNTNVEKQGNGITKNWLVQNLRGLPA
jgi:hypothetical protein